MAAWLGWLIESNWTDPFLFAVYSIVKPLSGAAILVIMYGIISGGNFNTPLFPYIYLGNAFYIYVGAVMTGVSWAVVDDREHYKTLKYMYIAPIYIPVYLLGRGVARFITGSIAVFITIMAGVLFLKVPLHFADINWGLFIVTLIVGVVNPFDQAYCVKLPACKVAAPEHRVLGPVMVGVGVGTLAPTVWVSVPVQPLASVTVTV